MVAGFWYNYNPQAYSIAVVAGFWYNYRGSETSTWLKAYSIVIVAWWLVSDTI